ncbi:sensor domain-containing protein [Methylovulum psychrotolerans]|uniref:Sensor domain-containing diguanylate cyclase n=1 Tax=Methylovulum psychrotolerans TaxID=1704499 RepID=A0A2S5CT54_9GAMM|nr:sensor domain-containing diguanylate cyclase [Methylovulum psychrotolerans]POZ54003.1 sensor domain-containing diguanylate cyclase [Methylovulum psychrotolerans]
MSTLNSGIAAPFSVPEGSVYLANEMLPDFLGQLPNGVAYGKILYQNGQAYDCAYFYTNPAFQRQSGLQDLSGQPDIFARYARVAAGGPPEHFQVFPDTFQAPYSVQVFSPKPEYFVCIVNTSPPPPTDSPSSPSARRYLCVLEDQTEIICRFLTDGTILYVNDAYCRFFGKSRESLIGKTWQPTAWAEDLPLINAKLAMLSPAQPVVTIENRLIAADGSLRWGQFVNRGFFDANGQLLEMQSVGRDITEQKQMEAALRESEKRFRLLADNAPVLIWMAGFDASRLYFNQVWLDFTGRTLAQERHQGWTENVHPDDLPHYLAAYQTALANREKFAVDYRLRRKDGAYRWLTDHGVPRYDDQGNFFGYIGSCIDITERHNKEEQAKQQALYDPLTKLANRRLLHERLEHTLATLKHHHGYGALLFLDLDNFKPLNDLHGHEIGDLLLIEVARRIGHCIRDIDTVARFGGDEFVVLISKLEAVEARAAACVHRVAERIRNQLAQPYTLTLPSGGDQAVVHHCTSSIGAALFGPKHSQAKQILKHADQAMYKAKANGRNRVHFYTPDDDL